MLADVDFKWVHLDRAARLVQQIVWPTPHQTILSHYALLVSRAKVSLLSIDAFLVVNCGLHPMAFAHLCRVLSHIQLFAPLNQLISELQ